MKNSGASVISHKSNISKHDSEETRTLRYDTTDRYQEIDSAENVKKQKDMMYGQLQKIMDNRFQNEKQLQHSEENLDNVNSLNAPQNIVSPLSSAISSPNNNQSKSKGDTLNYQSKITEDVESSQNHWSQSNDDLITPRDHTTNSNMY